MKQILLIAVGAGVIVAIIANPEGFITVLNAIYRGFTDIIYAASGFPTERYTTRR